MHKLTSLPGYCSLLITCNVLSVGVCHAADQVTRISDRTAIRGQLTSLTPTEVVIERSNGDVIQIATDDVYNLRFDREPSALQRIRSNLRAAGYESAQNALTKLGSEYAPKDTRVVAEVKYLQAWCLAGLAETDKGQVEPAITALQNFDRSHGSNYRLFPARLLLAQLLISQDAEQADSLLQQLRECGLPGFELQAGVLLADTLLVADRIAEALPVYEDAVSRSSKLPAAATAWFAAQTGRAECLRRQKQFEQALASLDEIIAQATEEQPAVLARAWNRKGDCHLDAQNEKAALMAFLHVDILYSTIRDSHAESLYQLSKLWESVGHPGRAVDAKTRLHELYADSSWALQDKAE